MKARHTALLINVHPEWRELLRDALDAMDPGYLHGLRSSSDWLPGQGLLLAAFRTPLSQARYMLFGESPYPRQTSANGYAFWDAAVGSLWSQRGLSKEINRATSLRNLMKMCLYARGSLQADRTQDAIAKLDQSIYYQTADSLFTGLLKKGFILLNASLVYQEGKIHYHARMWRPFIRVLLDRLVAHNSSVQLILFGRIAEKIPGRERFSCLMAEHPYNLSFITNPQVVDFFNPLDILLDHDKKHHG